MKIETGVMVIRDGRAWGVLYEDARETNYGWVPIEDGMIKDPLYCKKPTDMTYRGGSVEAVLSTGKLVHVERRTEIILKDDPT